MARRRERVGLCWANHRRIPEVADVESEVLDGDVLDELPEVECRLHRGHQVCELVGDQSTEGCELVLLAGPCDPPALFEGLERPADGRAGGIDGRS
ncbi:MAG: hypothetical protein U5K37_06540 [Natrialbaceae archaeon]|nr:hypothetical protein [Natrialbaceae archaeon]